MFALFSCHLIFLSAQRMHNLRIFFAIVLFQHVQLIFAAHYRGSMLSWRIVNSSSTNVRLEILQRHVWHFYFALCNNSQIIAANVPVGSGNLNCASPCAANVTTLTSVAAPCTDFNIPENYTTTEGRRQLTLPINRTLIAFFEGSSWFTLAQGGGNWSVAVQMNTTRRNDGRFNQAPIITMLPVIRLKRYLTSNIRINVADNDFDPYRCLWSSTWIECGGICMQVPNTTVLNPTTCMLKFTPVKLGYYAIALTVADYESTTSATSLSRVPVQFLFKVWDSNDSCVLPPIYLGDVPPDECIYIEPGEVRVMRILIRVRCPNATLDNIITSNPPGFVRSSTYLDPFDSTINIFMFNYTAKIEQIGQNLFCFAGVDSIGNQADTTCLRFTVQQGTSSLNTLYIRNSTRTPMGLVNKFQTNWTLIYPSGISYSRPNVSAYVRFKISSTQIDFYKLDVAKSTDVAFLNDRLVVTSRVVFTPSENFFISFDPGVFLATSTCFRDSMGITDPLFWPFQIPPEPNTTSTTTETTTTTKSTTGRIRTSPAVKTISSTFLSTTRTATIDTSPNIFVEIVTTSSKKFSEKKTFPISATVGIFLLTLIVVGLGTKIVEILRTKAKPTEELPNENEENFLEEKTKYRLAKRTRKPADQPNLSLNLIEIEC